MYGCYNGRVVYGWREGAREYLIADKWLREHGIGEFAIDVVKEHGGEFVYGVRCDLDETTGHATIHAKEKRRVKAAHRASGSRSTLGFHAAVSGDYDIDFSTVYVPRDDDRRSPTRAAKRRRTDGADSS